MVSGIHLVIATKSVITHAVTHGVHKMVNLNGVISIVKTGNGASRNVFIATGCLISKLNKITVVINALQEGVEMRSNVWDISFKLLKSALEVIGIETKTLRDILVLHKLTLIPINLIVIGYARANSVINDRSNGLWVGVKIVELSKSLIKLPITAE